ncbi:GNAT family N-acetyltransferase [Nigerium massiliense]|uniref:GNAT family N-acetyltransferase n=1 Tax=Nigerium massiliense TaxID=1522317 RepID=UPI001C477959|nr:GNAT family N-acetyltransferase [Nigerium massiliense]
MQIRPLDLASDAELAGVDDLTQAVYADTFGGITPQSAAQLRVEFEDTPFWTQNRWVAIDESDGQRVVGVASMLLPLAENLESASLNVTVHPLFRGRGVGTALVEDALKPAMRASGRTRADAYGDVPADGDPDDPALPVNRLAARLNMRRGATAICRILDLPLDPALLDALADEASARMGGYRIESWQGATPEAHLEEYGRLLTQLELDDPLEELDYEAPVYTPERVRLAEERLRRSGTRSITAVAIAPDGSFAGNCEVHVVDDPRATLGWQENTLVMPGHRGHRLGLGLKVATHRRIAAEAPGVRRIVTWNSHVNPWMIAINERLGYAISHREVAFQGDPFGD